MPKRAAAPPGIPFALACVASVKILRRESSVKWAMREESENANDSGWRFYSEDDTPEFLESPSSMRIVNFNAVGELFPIIYLLYFQPVGSEYMLVKDDKDDSLHWYDYKTLEGGKLSPLVVDDAFWGRYWEQWEAESERAHQLFYSDERPQ